MGGGGAGNSIAFRKSKRVRVLYMMLIHDVDAKSWSRTDEPKTFNPIKSRKQSWMAETDHQKMYIMSCILNNLQLKIYNKGCQLKTTKTYLKTKI